MHSSGVTEVDVLRRNDVSDGSAVRSIGIGTVDASTSGVVARGREASPVFDAGPGHAIGD